MDYAQTLYKKVCFEIDLFFLKSKQLNSPQSKSSSYFSVEIKQ